jgi:hypothetical protein
MAKQRTLGYKAGLLPQGSVPSTLRTLTTQLCTRIEAAATVPAIIRSTATLQKTLEQ